jgi:hypothetical protein
MVFFITHTVLNLYYQIKNFGVGHHFGRHVSPPFGKKPLAKGGLGRFSSLFSSPMAETMTIAKISHKNNRLSYK